MKKILEITDNSTNPVNYITTSDQNQLVYELQQDLEAIDNNQISFGSVIINRTVTTNQNVNNTNLRTQSYWSDNKQYLAYFQVFSPTSMLNTFTIRKVANGTYQLTLAFKILTTRYGSFSYKISYDRNPGTSGGFANSSAITNTMSIYSIDAKADIQR